jgi:hypothetical protein
MHDLIRQRRSAGADALPDQRHQDRTRRWPNANVLRELPPLSLIYNNVEGSVDQFKLQSLFLLISFSLGGPAGRRLVDAACRSHRRFVGKDTDDVGAALGRRLSATCSTAAS